MNYDVSGLKRARCHLEAIRHSDALESHLGDLIDAGCGATNLQRLVIRPGEREGDEAVIFVTPDTTTEEYYSERGVLSQRAVAVYQARGYDADELNCDEHDWKMAELEPLLHDAQRDMDAWIESIDEELAAM